MSYLPQKPMKKVLKEEIVADLPQKTFTAQSNSINGTTHTVYKPTQVAKMPVVIRNSSTNK
jgi:hypothetical protein